MANLDNGPARKLKAERNRALYATLMDVLEECRTTRKAELVSNRISRIWLAEQIGCDLKTLSNSPRLRNYIKTWERHHFSTLEHAVRRVQQTLPETDAEAVEGNVLMFRKLTDDGRIVQASYRKSPRTIVPIPTLVWRDGIDVEVSDYSRYLILKTNLDEDSVEEYVKVLRIFTRYRRGLGVTWRMVDDNTLLGWQVQMLGADIPVPRRNYCLTIVYAFYRWAEDTGRLKYHVRIARRTDYPRDMYDYQFPISSVEVKSKARRGTRVRWQTPLTERIGHGGYGFRHTPNTEQINELFGLVRQDGEHGVRNHLMMSWALECGARLHELLQPTLDDLPSMDQISELMDSDTWVIKVKRKGQKGKTGKLILSADLIFRTLEYIRFERKAVVEKCRAAGKEPSEFVFISSRTGQPLHGDSVTRICGKIFRAAKVERANIHRLRAAFITQEVERCLDAVEHGGNSMDLTSNWHETVLTMAAQLMGHTSILSLRPYLNQLLVRRLQREAAKKEGLEPTDAELQRTSHEFAAANADLIRAMGLRMRHNFKEAAEIIEKQLIDTKRLSENTILMAA
ncbi:tyrosine-type recombinase/integrase [Rhizobium leguminosarum]|uniref:tyrosine-type recombinase/integrase n=1 Tax=Rhizobium leguminosarum TaxID=384 RepID=UPI001C973981|nr:site-specific integrase [Rhizobium leguminosarum]MBY5431016.1 site-specific integrase [Rhizobium leguminosarum]